MEKSRSFPPSSSSSGYNRFELFEEEPSSSKAYSFNGAPPGNKATQMMRMRCSSNPESRRKKRVASYNAFVMEAKLKTSVRNSFKWIKTKFIGIW